MYKSARCACDDGTMTLWVSRAKATTSDSPDEARRQHLEFVQAAVSRMAAGSGRAKTWLLPVATAAYGYALAQRAWPVALVGIGAAILFAFLDARYLREERAFRVLFRRAVAGTVPLYEMNSRAYYGKPNGDDEDLRSENCRWRAIIPSWSVLGFYGPVAAAGVLLISILVFRGP